MNQVTFHKYPKIRQLGHEENKDIFSNDEDIIVLEEKYDGANFRFYKHQDGYLVFGSRTQELHEDKEHKFAKNFVRCIEYIKEKLNDRLDDVPDRCIFYGECMVRHSIDYNWETIPPFLGFDIMDMETGEFIPSVETHEIYKKIGLETVEIVDILTAKECRELDISNDWVPVSKYPPTTAPNMQAEGVVFKNQMNGIRAKYVRDSFKETNAEVFGGNPKYNGDGYEPEFVFKYCTNARIDKCIFKLLDEGKPLEMKLMEHLPKRVWTDIWEEEWKEIIFEDAKNKTLDYQKARKLVTKRCLAVLKQAMVNNTR